MEGKPVHLQVTSRSRAKGEFGQQLKQQSAVMWLEEPYEYLLAINNGTLCLGLTLYIQVDGFISSVNSMVKL